MNRPPVSVVIPTHNTSHLLTEAIDSVLAQTLPASEIIVVDDGSQDDTQERLAPYRNRIQYLYQENQGVSATRNYGIRTARGDLIAFLDADDVWHPRKIELQVKALTENPDLGLLGTGTFDWPAPVVPEAKGPLSGAVARVPWHQLVVKNYFTTSSVLVRHNLVTKVGLFDSALSVAEDHDLWLRLAEVSTVANLDLPLTGYRSVPGSLSQRAKAMDAGMHRLLRKLDQRKVWDGKRLLRRKAFSYLHYSCAYMYGAEGRQKMALRNVLRSLAWYPFPYRRSEVRMSLARPKTLLIILLRMLRMVREEPQAV
jgi:glycosyltransferase involved in cell wall biosynthesis